MKQGSTQHFIRKDVSGYQHKEEVNVDNKLEQLMRRHHRLSFICFCRGSIKCRFCRESERLYQEIIKRIKEKKHE